MGEDQSPSSLRSTRGWPHPLAFTRALHLRAFPNGSRGRRHLAPRPCPGLLRLSERAGAEGTRQPLSVVGFTEGKPPADGRKEPLPPGEDLGGIRSRTRGRGGNLGARQAPGAACERLWELPAPRRRAGQADRVPRPRRTQRGAGGSHESRAVRPQAVLSPLESLKEKMCLQS